MCSAAGFRKYTSCAQASALGTPWLMGFYCSQLGPCGSFGRTDTPFLDSQDCHEDAYEMLGAELILSSAISGYSLNRCAMLK